MSALLKELAQRGINIVLRDGHLALTARKGVITPEVIAQVKAQRAEVLRQIVVEQAFALADQVNDALHITDPLAREHNRLGWAVCDLQDAGFPEEVWGPLRERELALGREWEREQRG